MSMQDYPIMDWRSQTNEDLVLLDEEFLATLSEQKDHQIYARIIALDINENPIDRIEGRVTGGSINIDGNSTVRRTCNLTLVCDQIDINDFYWGIKTKFKLSIGLQNNLVGKYSYIENGKYPKIVWFKQGTFVVASFNTSISINSCTISISGKDKMSLLNGDLGGSLFSSIDFGTEKTVTKTMNPVGTIDGISSDTLVTQEYYFKPNQNNNEPSTILASDQKYVFILNEQNGYYIKDGNLYRHNELPYKSCRDENSINENVTYYILDNDEYTEVQDPNIDNIGSYYIKIFDGFKHYDMYQQITQPNELFDIENPVDTYDTNQKLFYIKYSNNQSEQNYFVLATAARQDVNHYYKLKQLFTLGYETTIKHITIEKIIREAVHTYASEPYHNIIINDLDDYGLEQLSYKGDKVLFAIRDAKSGLFVNLLFAENFETTHQYLGWEFQWSADRKDIENIRINNETNETFVFDELSSENTSVTGTILKVEEDQTYSIVDAIPENDNHKYITIAKIIYGMDLGYRLTDLTYPGDLISSIGENLTSILDKIKNMLSDFEYFYDLEGRFVFQKKKIYVNTSWSQLTETEDESYVAYGNEKRKFSFNFEGNRLISAFQNNPALNNLRNDFVVWGKRQSISGADVPIHARYAIDKKPVYYKSLSNEIYTTDIEYAYEQIPDFKPQTLIGINEEIQNRLIALQNFTLNYPIRADLHLAPPVRKNSYGWEPGWWDIRDWARYYKLVTTGTTEGPDPNGTMKFYSSNDAYGCISIGKLLQDGVPLPLGPAYSNSHVWLLEETSSGSINCNHGRGTYRDTVTQACTYYTSEMINGRVVTTKTDRIEQFHWPYAGCSDTHTYLYFLYQINAGIDNAVYFYNPSFPFGETEEELVISNIAKDFENDIKKYHIHIVDWREIIYQMALDYFAGQGCSEKNPIYTFTWDWNNNTRQCKNIQATICCNDPDHFLYEVGIRNPYYYPTGYTGYEQYYTDLQGFWRQLYNPEYTPQAEYSEGKYAITVESSNNQTIRQKQWQSPQITDLNIEYYFYEPDEHIQTFKITNPSLWTEVSEDEYTQAINNTLQLEYYKYAVSETDFLTETDKGKKRYWNKLVFESPESLNFWFDFLDSDTELASFSVKSVGDRTKVVNEDKAKAIWYKEIPGLIVYERSQTTEISDGNIQLDYTTLRNSIAENSGYVFVYLPKGFSQYLTISYRGTSVKNKIDELIYQYSYCVENISITSIPVYYLQPNTRIYVQDKNTGVEGEYIVSRITIPLAYNGTMLISAVKAPERLY